HRRGPRGCGQPGAAPSWRSDEAAAGSHLRFALRHVPRRDHLRPRGRRRDHPAHPGPDDEHRQGARGRRGRLVRAPATTRRKADRRRGRLRHRGDQERGRRTGRRHDHDGRARRDHAASGLPARQADGLRAAVSERVGPVRGPKEALEKLQLNDAALSFEPENSAALGFGFRCGFLGLLHLEIVQERLEREFELELITTAPTVEYEVKLRRGGMVHVDNPSLLPDPTTMESIAEPFVKLSIIVPSTYVGSMMELCQDRRGMFKHLEHRPGERIVLEYETPLGEIIHDFYDQLKSRSKGYASMDYEMIGFREGELVKLDVLV